MLWITRNRHVILQDKAFGDYLSVGIRKVTFGYGTSLQTLFCWVTDDTALALVHTPACELRFPKQLHCSSTEVNVFDLTTNSIWLMCLDLELNTIYTLTHWSIPLKTLFLARCHLLPRDQSVCFHKNKLFLLSWIMPLFSPHLLADVCVYCTFGLQTVQWEQCVAAQPTGLW